MNYIEKLFSLKGKVAVVVGGSGELGGEMSFALSQAGAKVAVSYAGNKEGATEQISRIESAGGTAMACQINAISEDSIKSAISKVIDEWGHIDILVNAPGVNSTTPIMDITEEEWNKILDINLKGAFLTSRIVGEHMIERGEGGSIINISSASSDIPLSKVFTYSISKAGMNNMTRFLAREWAPHDIRVNAIIPGFFPAEQNREILTEERTESIFGHTPMDRFGEAEELSGAVVWLASKNASSFVTGSMVTVDGGFTATTI
ncbi:MAG: gluconate 5-dehydrogenase [Balneola sp.]|jgi:NAD(P)-dependent dehydrogenase (short-subunit alcohol dehydrogenase family)|nr:gluconate 5-dehydrogenase [Balneola sp.]MBE77540.1 gluconate 5-dehydrogenase [Balneola sp.]|tara:strand:+ start:59 stop:841 length:783 start_codon:yes stop_codon:yes gene_type:complete